MLGQGVSLSFVKPSALRRGVVFVRRDRQSSGAVGPKEVLP
jgi:hypothetical protein